MWRTAWQELGSSMVTMRAINCSRPHTFGLLDRLRLEPHAGIVSFFTNRSLGPARSSGSRAYSHLALLLLLPISIAAADKTASIPDFTFIHASDVHTPMAQSKATLSVIPSLGEIDMEPYGLKAPKPSFAIVSGDLTEFGGGSGWWHEYLSYWNGCGFHVYHGLGNHDNTWHANLKNMRDSGLAPYYSFDEKGCHFVSFMTATAQDPRPSVAEDQLLWLKKDLDKTGKHTPVFIYFHHPLGPGDEFASRYDYDRLIDVLHDYNTVLILAGHTHRYAYRPIENIDQTTGGSTFGEAPGFAVITVKDGVLREAYWKSGRPAPEIKLLEKQIPDRAPFSEVEINSPEFRETAGDTLDVAARLSCPLEIEKARYTVDDELGGDLKLAGHAPKWKATGKANVSGLLPGAHYLRVDFIKGGRHYSHSTEFFFEPASHPTAWRSYLAASSKVTPALAEGVVYVGANDGRLTAFKASSGKKLWSVETGAEILAEPLIANGMIYTANGLGLVSAYNLAGKRQWSFTADDAVYSSPVIAADKVIFGCNDGKLYALDATNGQLAWVNTNATYAIESKPFVSEGKVYFGGWDQFIRCVNVADGKQVWERLCEGSSTARAAKRYYSAADAMPVVVDGRLMIADRAQKLTILDAQTGEPVKSLEKVSATGVSEDKKFAYLRRMDGKLTKVDRSGAELWSTPAHMGAVPVAPTEKNGVVYVSSGKGTVSGIDAASGNILWQYQASPQLYVMGSVVSDGANAYLTSFDGSLTAIKCRYPARAN